MPCKHCHKQPARKPRTKRMKTSSAKAKGRRLQQFVRDELRKLAPQLDPTDIESTPMGVNGVDVVLTKAARAVFGELAIECKNVEILNAVGVFQGHCDKYQPKGKVPIMVHSRNHIDPRITMLWSDFVRLYLKPQVECKHLCGLVDDECLDCGQTITDIQAVTVAFIKAVE